MALSLIVLAPFPSLAECLYYNSRYRAPVFSSLGSILGAVSGFTGFLMMTGLCLLAAVYAVQGGKQSDAALKVQSWLLFLFVGLLFAARLLIRQLYFCEAGANAAALSHALDTALSIMVGSLVIGFPCLFIGSFLGAALYRMSGGVVRPLASGPRTAALLQRAAGCFWTALLICIAAFGWLGALPALGCFVLGCTANYAAALAAGIDQESSPALLPFRGLTSLLAFAMLAGVVLQDGLSSF